MAGDARSKLIAELVSEFVEERVRQFPSQVFDLAALKRAVATALRRAELALNSCPAMIARLQACSISTRFWSGQGTEPRSCGSQGWTEFARGRSTRKHPPQASESSAPLC